MKFTKEEKTLIKAARKKIQEWKKSQDNEYNKLMKVLNLKPRNFVHQYQTYGEIQRDLECDWLRQFLFSDEEFSVNELENLMRASYITEIESKNNEQD